MKLNKTKYEQLINEDIAWLKTKCPRTLEREHIIDVLRASIEHEYPNYCHDHKINNCDCKDIVSPKKNLID